MQIRETGPGNYPPVVYQPLRSPKSPYAKLGPGSSCTLPAKLGARLLSNQLNVCNKEKPLTERDSSIRQQLANIDVCPEDACSQRKSAIINKRNKQQRAILNVNAHDTDGQRTGADIDETDLEDAQDVTLMPKFLQHSALNDNHQQQMLLQESSSSSITSHDQLIHDDLIHDLRHKHRIHHHQETTTDNSNEANDHNERFIHSAADRGIRSSSEENSNASSNGGYFSEDSSQSISDLSGSPFELKVQVRQCSDEKLLKKNLSQDNLLRADYISRPNEKCKII